MKVIIIGATGFIGMPAAQAFVRAGHIVYGVTRSQSNAAALAKEEIVPVVADSSTPEGLRKLDDIACLADVGEYRR
jgi:nucleoside-diphosphate-sugar epimerase